MKYIALLCGEHTELSLTELRSYVEARGLKFGIVEKDGRIVVFDTGFDIDFSNLALTHEVSLFFGHKVDDVDVSKLDGNVSVRAVKIDDHASFRSNSLEKAVGGKLHESGRRIDFSSSCVVRIYVTHTKCYYGVLRCAVDRKALRARDAKSRPYLMIGSINAIYARAFVNLMSCAPGDIIADPFCGSGAFLIEAGMMGVEVFGCDISEKHSSGCIRNLSHYGVKRHDVRVMDALDITDLKKRFDGVVTDLPWGKSTLMKYNKDELFRKFMKILPKILEKGKYAVIAGDTPELWYPKKLHLVDRFELYVHRSAKRYVWIFRNA